MNEEIKPLPCPRCNGNGSFTIGTTDRPVQAQCPACYGTGHSDRAAKPLPCSNSYPLFKHMSDEHGLTLLESELTEITRKVDECRAADPRLAELAQEHATLRYSLAELRAIADQLRTDLELLTLAETQRRPSIIDLEEWKARNPE